MAALPPSSTPTAATPNSRLTLSCHGTQRADVVFDLTNVTLRRSSNPTYASAGRWNEFEGDYRLQAGTIRRTGRLAGHREADYVFLAGDTLPAEPLTVRLTISSQQHPIGRSVQWYLGPNDPRTRSGEDSASLTCTGTLLTAPVPPS